MTMRPVYQHTCEIEAASAASAVIVPKVLNLLRDKVSPKQSIESVVDVGGGTGAWLRSFLELGADSVLLFDSPLVLPDLVVPSQCFSPIDLAREMPTIKGFDLALCLECAEHLPARQAVPLVQCLTQAAPLVLFSAAIPGQPGIGHINCQPLSYWRSAFAECGFDSFDVVRPMILSDKSIPNWYRQNIILFCQKPIAVSAEVQRFPNDFILVSEDIFSQIMRPSLKQTVRRLVPALLASIRFHIGKLLTK